MGALLAQIIKVALQVLAGVGIGSVLDKVAADKVPGYVSGNLPSDAVPWEAGFKPMRLVGIVIPLVIAGMMIAFIAKKFRIKLLK